MDRQMTHLLVIVIILAIMTAVNCGGRRHYDLTHGCHNYYYNDDDDFFIKSESKHLKEVKAIIKQGYRKILNRLKSHKFDEVKPHEWPWKKCKFPYPTQSPIDLNIVDLKMENLPWLNFYMDWSLVKKDVVITNNGHTWSISLAPNVDDPPYLTNGPLSPGRYIFHEAHGHWSSENFAGSEHTVIGRSYSMEIHMVFTKEEYNGLENARKYPDGVSVVTFFGEVAPRDNPDLNDLIAKIPQIIQPGSTVNGSFGQEFKFLQKTAHGQTYYTYPGSLTTPGYEECVTWIIFVGPFSLSRQQLNSFHQLISNTGNHIGINDRELQDGHHRPLITPMNPRSVRVIIDYED